MIITSLLDTDLYKFTMMQVVLHHFPEAQVEYRFKCRNAGRRPDAVRRRDPATRSARSCALRFTPRELDYLRSWRFFKSDFVDLLGLFQLDERFIHVAGSDGPTREIDITIKGPWLHTILFEVPVLAIVSRGLLPQCAPRARLRRGAPPARGQDRAIERACPTPSSGSPTTARAGASRATGRRR